MNNLNCLILFFLSLILSSFKLNAQSKVDGIQRFQLKISHNQKEINYGASEFTILQKFGTPVDNQPFEFEMDEVIGREIKHNNFRFLLMDNQIRFFELLTSNAQLTYNGVAIRIGDPISALGNFYPKYTNFLCDNGKNGYCINLLDNGRFDEGFVLRIYYDTATNKITQIFTHQN